MIKSIKLITTCLFEKMNYNLAIAFSKHVPVRKVWILMQGNKKCLQCWEYDRIEQNISGESIDFYIFFKDSLF
jgi:hypothetical protein